MENLGDILPYIIDVKEKIPAKLKQGKSLIKNQSETICNSSVIGFDKLETILLTITNSKNFMLKKSYIITLL